MNTKASESSKIDAALPENDRGVRREKDNIPSPSLGTITTRKQRKGGSPVTGQAGRHSPSDTSFPASEPTKKA